MENNCTEKKAYHRPELCIIDIDAEISLALESDPPNPGNENLSPDYHQIINIFK